MRYLYIFPTEVEATTFRRLSPHSDIVISGVGMAATAATVTRLFAESRIDDSCCVVLCGIAGSYGDSVAVGDVVEVVSECCAELPERFQRVYNVPRRTNLRTVCSNSVHRSMSESHGAEIENMEGAALFALAEELGFQAIEIRAVSNRVGDNFAEWRVEKALDELAKVLITLE